MRSHNLRRLSADRQGRTDFDLRDGKFCVQTEIPLIDLAPLKNGLAGALEETGFLIIVNHGVPQDLIERTFTEAKRFHDRPMEIKHALRMNPHYNGYMTEGRYNVRTSRVSEKSVKPDANEAFFLKRERSADDPLLLADRRFAGPNQWPDNLPGFRETVIEYTDAVDVMTKRLLPALALSLDLDAEFFSTAVSSLSGYRTTHRWPGKTGSMASHRTRM
jgi:isopenicillin N synthase-like dioxygenase